MQRHRRRRRRCGGRLQRCKGTLLGSALLGTPFRGADSLEIDNGGAREQARAQTSAPEQRWNAVLECAKMPIRFRCVNNTVRIEHQSMHSGGWEDGNSTHKKTAKKLLLPFIPPIRVRLRAARWYCVHSICSINLQAHTHILPTLGPLFRYIILSWLGVAGWLAGWVWAERE